MHRYAELCKTQYIGKAGESLIKHENIANVMEFEI